MKTRPIWPITALLAGITLSLIAMKLLALIKLSWLWILAASWLPAAMLLCGLLVGHFFSGKRPVDVPPPSRDKLRGNVL